MAANDLGSFARRISKRGDDVVTNATKIQRATAGAVDRAVVYSTPVDEGRARSNWIVTTHSPETTEIMPYSPGQGGSTAAANAAAAIQQGHDVIASSPPGEDIYISNNLPYIQRLNDGYSAQAPAGFVEQAVQAGAQLVKQMRILDGN